MILLYYNESLFQYLVKYNLFVEYRQRNKTNNNNNFFYSKDIYLTILFLQIAFLHIFHYLFHNQLFLLTLNH